MTILLEISPQLWLPAAGFYTGLLAALHPVPRAWLRRRFEHPRPPSTGTVMPALDGLRGIAILMVLSFHLFQWFNPAFGALGANPAILNGWAGVELFVALSGYLIYGALVSARERGYSLRHYFRRRFLRIYPVYLAACLITTALLLSQQSPFAWHQARLSAVAGAEEMAKTILGALFLVRGVNWSAPENLNPPAWSLGVEVSFYLLAPLAAALSARKPLAAAVLGFALLFVLKRFEPRELGIFCFFWVGILAWELHRHPALFLRKASVLWAAFALGCALTAWFLCLPLVDLQGQHLYPRHHRTGFLALGLLLVLVAAPRLQPVSAMLSIYPLRFVGLVSYSAFLLHFPFYSISGIETLPALPPFTSSLLLLLIVFPGIFCIAALSFAAIESRFMACQVQATSRSKIT